MRAVFLIFCVILVAGCSSTISAPTVFSSSDLTSYFWPDSNKTYQYQSQDGNIHTLQITPGNTITISDRDQSSGATTILSAAISNNACEVTGLSATDLLGMDPSIEMVADTNPPITSQPITIHSIAASDNGSNKIFVASDSILYQYDAASDTLINSHALPAHGVTLYGDSRSPTLYAFIPNGNTVWATVNNGRDWQQYQLPSSAGGIVGILPAMSEGHDADGDLFWVGSGTALYEYSSTKGWKTSPISGGASITAMDRDNSLCALSDKHLISFDEGGINTVGPILPDIVVAIASRLISPGFFATIVATPSNVYSISTYSATRLGGQVSSLYSVPFEIFLGMPDGSIQFSQDGASLSTDGSVGTLPVTQFTRPLSFPDTTQTIYALSGGHFYYHYQSSPSTNWKLAKASISTAGSPQTGAFTLLNNDSNTWTAGLVVQTSSGVSHGFVYRAQKVTSAFAIVFDSVTYNDIVVIRYTAQSGGVQDSVNLPQYLIYFQRNIGPIRIERTENGMTVVTKLVKIL